MRTATVSTLCVFLLLICSPKPTVGQDKPSSPSLGLQSRPASESFELQRAAETGTVPAQTDSKSTNTQQSWLEILAQQNRSHVDQLWSFKKGILPQPEAPQCAHIIIFRAPETDSQMIVEAPPGLGGNITTFKGLHPCCGDLRGLHGLAPITPKAPSLQRPLLMPRKNGQTAPNFENWQNRLHP